MARKKAEVVVNKVNQASEPCKHPNPVQFAGVQDVQWCAECGAARFAGGQVGETSKAPRWRRPAESRAKRAKDNFFGTDRTPKTPFQKHTAKMSAKLAVVPKPKKMRVARAQPAAAAI